MLFLATESARDGDDDDDENERQTDGRTDGKAFISHAFEMDVRMSPGRRS